MKKALLFLLVFLGPLALAQVDTRDGTSITTDTTIDSVSTADTADGQAIKAAAGGPTVDEDFTACTNMTDIEQGITCAAGVATGSYNYGLNTAYSGTALSTANHYAEIDGHWNSSSPDLSAPLVRCDGNGTSATGYFVTYNNSGADIGVTLWRFAGATETYIGGGTLTSQQLTTTVSYKMRLKVNSSNQFSFWIDADDDGTYQADEKLANFQTDATYTGDVRVGIAIYKDSGSTVNVDWLQGDDE